MARDPRGIPNDALALLIARGVGDTARRRLLEAFGGADGAGEALRAWRSTSARRPEPTSRLAGALRACAADAHRLRSALDGADVAGERAAMERVGARLVVLGDPDFPPLLAAIDDPPPCLWVRGDATVLGQVGLAIVGSRRCTAYGRLQAARFASLLASSGVAVVSGGARGIDEAAHAAALRCGGATIGVLGCGLSHCYPAEHAELFDRIASNGCLVSEVPMGQGPRAALFPRRNRIISGLSVGVLVVEAAVRSGALITARLAAEAQGREAMALPGPVDSIASAGCHRAIREGWAALVTSPSEVFAQLEGAGALVHGALRAAGGSSRALGEQADGHGPSGAELDAARRGGAEGIEALAQARGEPVEAVLRALTMHLVRKGGGG